MLQFAGGQVILAQDKDDLVYTTRKTKKEYEKWGLPINIDRKQYLFIERPQSSLQSEDNEQIKACRTYKACTYVSFSVKVGKI